MKNSEFKKLPIIALLADSYGVPKETGTGFTDVLTKPFKCKDLIRIIEEHGSKSV